MSNVLTGTHKAEHLYVSRKETGMAVLRSCKLCKFADVRRKVSNAGRGNGMREGNKQRGRLIQHLKSDHPAEYAAAMSIPNNVFFA